MYDTLRANSNHGVSGRTNGCYYPVPHPKLRYWYHGAGVEQLDTNGGYLRHLVSVHARQQLVHMEHEWQDFCQRLSHSGM
jgi:hypothetical protein